METYRGYRDVIAPISLHVGDAGTNLNDNPALRDPKVRAALTTRCPRATTLFNGLARPPDQAFPPHIPYAPKAGSRPLEFNADVRRPDRR